MLIASMITFNLDLIFLSNLSLSASDPPFFAALAIPEYELRQRLST